MSPCDALPAAPGRLAARGFAGTVRSDLRSAAGVTARNVAARCRPATSTSPAALLGERILGLADFRIQRDKRPLGTSTGGTDAGGEPARSPVIAVNRGQFGGGRSLHVPATDGAP